jgi:hypothetical protein
MIFDHILNGSLATSPCARVCAGFTGDYSLRASVKKTAPTAQLFGNMNICGCLTAEKCIS